MALDGEIVHGEALVSTEHITGEALPVRRRPGDEVPAGALNHDGLLVVRCHTHSESYEVISSVIVVSDQKTSCCQDKL